MMRKEKNANEVETVKNGEKPDGQKIPCYNKEKTIAKVVTDFKTVLPCPPTLSMSMIVTQRMPLHRWMNRPESSSAPKCWRTEYFSLEAGL